MYPFTVTWEFWGYTIEFGPYRLFVFLSVLIVFTGSIFWAVKRGYTFKPILLIMSCLLLSALVGARLLNVLTHWPEYMAVPEKIFAFEAEGFSLYGGILSSVVTGYILSKALKLNPYILADTLIPFVGIGIAIYRIGCFLHGCCFGQGTGLPWGVTFPLLSPAHIYQMGIYGNFFEVRPVHPTQLYEMAAALILTIITFSLLSRKKTEGTALIVFMTGFTLFRIWNDTMRVEPNGLSVPTFFYPLLYGTILAYLAWHMHQIYVKRKRNILSA